MSNDWTNNIGKRMDEHRLDGFSDMWPDIEAAVKEAQAAQKRKRAHAAWLRRSVAAVAAAAAIVAALMWMPAADITQTKVDNASTAIPQGIAKAESDTPQAAVAGSTPKATVIAARHSATAHPMLLAQTTSDKSEPATTQAVASTEGVGQEAQIATHPASASQEGTSATGKAATPSAGDSKQSKATQSKTWAYDVSNTPFEIAKNDDGEKWDVGLFAFNSPAKIGSNGGDICFTSADGASEKPTIGSTNAVAPSIGVVDVELHHKQPVSVGASVRYNIDRHWSVETGLTYTYLNSDYSNSQVNCEQRLHYLGIPVKVNFNLYSNRRVNVYLTGGGMAEKLVSGRFKATYTQTKGYNNSISLKEGGLQWSIKGAAGIAFNISPAISIYAEPGIGHYFDNGSNMKSFYKDSPTCFNLLVGLRFNTGH